MKNKTLAELKLVRWLKTVVNSKEEYDYLISEERKILSSLSFMIKELKGGYSKMEQEIDTQKAYEKAMSILTEIKQNAPELVENISLVGVWLWAEFEEQPNRETIDYLKSLGFKWNKARNAWQNSCGVLRRRSERNPKDFYPVISAETVRFRVVAEPAVEAVR